MLKDIAIKKVISYLNSDPDENIPKALDWAEKYLPGVKDDPRFYKIKEAALDENSNWYKLIRSIWDLDEEVRETIIVNFFLNGYLEWKDKRPKLMKKYGCSIPWTILMDPTSGCNLKCIGCWAADYGNKLNLDYETLDSIVKQGKDLGIYVYLFSGGEPLVAKNRILKLCEAHPDCLFVSFTNGTLIDEDFAKEMLRVKNFIPTISVEGFESATDFRRGNGTFKKIEEAMDILRDHKLPFGASCCYTSENIDSLSSEAYFDWLVEKGAKYAWFFTFMPIGVNSTSELMARPEQREKMYHAIRDFRKTKPLFTIDFWNDGEYVHGCIAGGRNYLHINANGDVEPCAFIHYSNINIKENSLIECLQSDLFKEYQAGQPFNDNHLKPCPLLDNPGRLQQMVHKSNAKSTDMEAPEDVDDLTEKVLDAAKNWSPTADKLWEQSQKNK
ncbi:radical SAM protein [Neofamilia massiliensis]|uniref:radical SAM protein n=1 Tax=Neofamilia massiliensis TaxID=1673724 RepID=UPI000AC5A0FC|nr:radical SAM protein [Neofamilia massiliensis]